MPNLDGFNPTSKRCKWFRKGMATRWTGKNGAIHTYSSESILRNKRWRDRGNVRICNAVRGFLESTNADSLTGDQVRTMERANWRIEAISTL